MKQLIFTIILCSSIFASTELFGQGQPEKSEILTIIINWEIKGEHPVYISEFGKETIKQTLTGKFPGNDLAEVSMNLNSLLNKYERNGWSLMSTFNMNTHSPIQCFIFKKE